MMDTAVQAARLIGLCATIAVSAGVLACAYAKLKAWQWRHQMIELYGEAYIEECENRAGPLTSRAMAWKLLTAFTKATVDNTKHYAGQPKPHHHD